MPLGFCAGSPAPEGGGFTRFARTAPGERIRYSHVFGSEHAVIDYSSSLNTIFSSAQNAASGSGKALFGMHYESIYDSATSRAAHAPILGTSGRKLTDVPLEAGKAKHM